MGIVYTAKCENCGYVKQLYAGGGRMDCTLSAFLKELPEEKQEILKKSVSDGARASITRNKCVCDDCGEIYAVPVVMIELNGKKDCLMEFVRNAYLKIILKLIIKLPVLSAKSRSRLNGQDYGIKGEVTK